jgi:thiamine pyrophosphate-dependent acetolactate synthase large subunit-like protein
MAEADRKPRIDGGAAVARTLAAAKVKTIFALHGGHLDAAFKGFLDEGIELVDTRHEACAGHAAEGWARLTGGLGVCMITAGPGFTNALTSMANARLDGVPVLFLAGAPPLREESLNVLQGGVDQIAMAAPVVKLAIRITDPDRIPDQLANAITVALGGRPGPVFVELPIDVMARPARLPLALPLPVPPSRPRRCPSMSIRCCACWARRNAPWPFWARWRVIRRLRRRSRLSATGWAFRWCSPAAPWACSTPTIRPMPMIPAPLPSPRRRARRPISS